LWPENAAAIDLYWQFRTQWRTGFNGPIGLDYGGIQHELARRKLPPDDYDDLMACIRVIEQAALDEFHNG
jgi:hypothetical protein